VRIQGANVNIANVLFTDGNNTLIPISAGFVLHDITNNQVVPLTFGFFYKMAWQCDYVLYLWHQEVFTLKNQRQQAVIKGILGLNYQVI